LSATFEDAIPILALQNFQTDEHAQI